MAAELSKGSWSTAPRSKLCPSWKSFISTLNSWARCAHQFPLCPILNFLIFASCDWSLLTFIILCRVFACVLHVWTFHIFSLSLFLCSCGLLSVRMNVIVLLADITSDICDYLNIHLPPSLIPSRNIKAFHWRWHPKHIIQCPVMHCSRSEQFASIADVPVLTSFFPLYFFNLFFCKESNLTFK